MNTLKTGLLMALLFGLFMALGRLFGGPNGLILGFVFACVSNLGAYWFSDKLALSMSGARPVDERQAPALYEMVRGLTANANLPMPRLYVIPSGQPNAFATGRNPQNSAVAVTQGLLQMLSRDELEGVIAHELAHIKNRDILTSSIAATVAGAISFVAQMLSFQAFFGGGRRDDDGEGANPLAMLAGIILAPIAAILIQMAISRTREYSADASGATISGKPLALASALRRIERAAEMRPMEVSPTASHMYIINPLGGDALKNMAGLFRTHPQTEERIARLEAIAQEMRRAA